VFLFGGISYLTLYLDSKSITGGNNEMSGLKAREPKLSVGRAAVKFLSVNLTVVDT
jgi:hypothetical protein